MAGKKGVVRRSIVDFEKWVDGAIESAETELRGLGLEQETVLHKRTMQQIQLDTLRRVKHRLGQAKATDEAG